MYIPVEGTVLALVAFTLALATADSTGNNNNNNNNRRRKADRTNPSDTAQDLDKTLTDHGFNNRSGTILDGTFLHPKPEDIQVGCKELRSKRYISDGFCTSIKPITEVVCTGHCLPIRNLPWYAEFLKVWSRTKVMEWRCVNDVVRKRKVQLLCENGDTRTYRIRVVKSCKCKRYMRRQNQSNVDIKSERQQKDRKRRRRKNKDSENRAPQQPDSGL